MAYDAILLVSFGGPDGPEDVIPFLENVLRGRPVPRSRLLEVSEHYLAHGGISPINEQNKALIKALRSRMAESDLHIPIFWGNRNWHPTIPAAIEEMQKAGVKRFLALITSAYSSYSGCRQYRENINGALENSGSALAYDKVRVWYNHPLWIKTLVDRYQAALARGAGAPSPRDDHGIYRPQHPRFDVPKLQLPETTRGDLPTRCRRSGHRPLEIGLPESKRQAPRPLAGA